MSAPATEMLKPAQEVDDMKLSHDEIEDHKPKVPPTGGEHIPEYSTWSVKTSVFRFWKVILFTVGLCFGAAFDSYTLQVPGSIIANPGFIQDFGDVRDENGQVIALNPSQISNWNLLSLVGLIAGVAIGGFIGDRYGRKPALYLVLLLTSTGVVLSVAGQNTEAWSARAFIGGMGVGCMQASLIPYLTEIAPSRIRGFCTTTYVLFWSLGIVSGSIGLYVGDLVDPLNWRLALYGQFVFLAFFIPGLIFSPESPWWLARQERKDSALQAMRRLYSTVPSYDVEIEYDVIRAAIEAEKAFSATLDTTWRSYIDCFRGPNLRRTLVSSSGMFSQAFAGVALFFGNITYFFQQAGYPKPFEANLIVGCLQVLGVVVSISIVEWCGRRPLLIFGTGFCTLCCWALGGIAFMDAPNNVALVSLSCLWVVVYSMTLNPLGYAYVGEIPTQRLKSKTSSIVFAAYTGVQIALTYLVPYMLSPLEWGWGIKTGEHRDNGRSRGQC